MKFPKKCPQKNLDFINENLGVSFFLKNSTSPHTCLPPLKSFKHISQNCLSLVTIRFSIFHFFKILETNTEVNIIQERIKQGNPFQCHPHHPWSRHLENFSQGCRELFHHIHFRRSQ